MTRVIYALFAAAALILGGCGPLQEDNRFTQVYGIVGSQIFGDSETDPTPQPQLTRAAIEAQQTSLLQVSIFNFNSIDLLAPAAANGRRVTWFSSDGRAITFDLGLLVGTRGLGDDLMGADIAGAIRSLSGNDGGRHSRTMDFMNGLDQIERWVFQCETKNAGDEIITIVERSYQVTRWEEICTGESVRFRNLYWIGDDGIVWQSRQWVSENVGYLGYRRF